MSNMVSYPKIIQGGMGVGVSGWALARAVSELGQLGVVSGTALAVTLGRRLQLGDPEGHLRRALDHFPVPEIAARVVAEYFIPGGKPPDAPFKLSPVPDLRPRAALTELTVAANFVEVFLAKEGHAGVVGINYLEKIQLPTLPSLFGAMLAGVDYVLMGAGIPRSVPGVLDGFAQGKPAEIKVDVHDAVEESVTGFDPQSFFGRAAPALKRPRFLGIVSSATLAMTLARKSNGRVDGFIVEGESAGGHNAPPRGPMQLSAEGEPVYGPRDVPDLEKIRALNLPFWLAGSYGWPGKLAEALGLGAAGIQVGTAFAFCEESAIRSDLKERVLRQSCAGAASVFTDPLASPTGFPFKVARVQGTLSEPADYAARRRVCDLGYLRQAYRRADGSVGYRCPAEPVEEFQRKGGNLAETTGRICICNALPATIGLGQIRAQGTREPALVTAGRDVTELAQFLKPGSASYTAADVLRCLLAEAK